MTRQRSGRPHVPAPGPALAGASSDPFAGVERVFIDGSNLLHALARGARGSEPAPAGGHHRPAAGRVPGIGCRGPRLRRSAVGWRHRPPRDRPSRELLGAHLGRPRHRRRRRGAARGRRAGRDLGDPRGHRRSRPERRRAVEGRRTAGTAWITGRIGRLTTDRPRADRRGGAGWPTGAGLGRGRRGAPGAPLPKAGTTFGHRRPPRTLAGGRGMTPGTPHRRRTRLLGFRRDRRPRAARAADPRHHHGLRHAGLGRAHRAHPDLPPHRRGRPDPEPPRARLDPVRAPCPTAEGQPRDRRRSAPRSSTARPTTRAGEPYCPVDQLVFPFGAVTCDTCRRDLFVRCPKCSTGRAAHLSTCGNCGLVLRIENRARALRPAGPPPGGAAAA